MEKVWSGLKWIFEYLSKLDGHNVKEIIKTKIGLFFAGFVGGGSGIGSFLFLDASAEHSMPLAFVVKALGTVLVAFATGIATALGKDLVDHRRKEKEIKKKREDFKQSMKDHKDIWGKNGTHN